MAILFVYFLARLMPFDFINFAHLIIISTNNLISARVELSAVMASYLLTVLSSFGMVKDDTKSIRW